MLKAKLGYCGSCLKGIGSFSNDDGKITLTSDATEAPPKEEKKKPVARKKPAPKPVAGYECGVCGFRVVVDEVCGCVDEHVLVCCNKVMKPKKKR